MCYVDFAKHGIEQRRYLESFNTLFEDKLFTPVVLQSAFVTIYNNYRDNKPKPLPLAFMRMVLKAIGKHQQLYGYICDDLLPRLVIEELWKGSMEDKRQWQGVCRAFETLFPREGVRGERAKRASRSNTRRGNHLAYLNCTRRVA